MKKKTAVPPTEKNTGPEKSVARWTQRLADWYLKFARRLPWRESHDPYRIWISEVMLQQTQVATVIPYYEKFLRLFPTVNALAAAEIGDVLAAWSGLGYYSRARNLHRGAAYVVEKYRGEFPRTREEMRAIPGIGPYTAGAILSIAYDLAEPLVDGNVQRVFARFFGIDEKIESSATQKRFWDHAAAWVGAGESPRILNQALMELGATVCTKGAPKCSACPLRVDCYAFATGRQAELPRKKIRRTAVDLVWLSLVVERAGKLFVRKNPPGEWWSDMWDFPRVDAAPGSARYEQIEKLFPAAQRRRELDHRRHTVTHHRIEVIPFHIRVADLPESGLGDGRWVSPDEVEKLPISGLARKVLSSFYGKIEP